MTFFFIVSFISIELYFVPYWNGNSKKMHVHIWYPRELSHGDFVACNRINVSLLIQWLSTLARSLLVVRFWFSANKTKHKKKVLSSNCSHIDSLIVRSLYTAAIPLIYEMEKETEVHGTTYDKYIEKRRWRVVIEEEN